MIIFLKKYFKIDDMLVKDNNWSNSSVCKYFIQKSKNVGFNHIIGSLSSVDKEHFDRSTHYYKKFNFDVKLNAEKNLEVLDWT